MEEARKLFPEDKDVEKFHKLTLEDIELEKRVRNIMSNSELLKGKEYLDFLIDFLTGKKDQESGAKDIICQHELTEDEAKKLGETLSADKDIVYYFNVKDGFKVLVDSLFYNQYALEII